MNRHTFEINTLFTERELFALKEFYGGVRARLIRPKYGDPWYVVKRHRHLPQELYEAVKRELIRINLPARVRVSKFAGVPNSPRWQKCPHCVEWIEREDWRSGRYADMWLGHVSGCISCFQARVAAYRKEMGVV